MVGEKAEGGDWSLSERFRRTQTAAVRVKKTAVAGDGDATGSESDGEGLEGVEVPGVAVAGGGGEAEVGEAFEEDTEGGLHFEAGEGGADAEVDAGAEGYVGIGSAGGEELGGGGEFLLVAVGGGEEESDLVAFFQRDTAVFEVFECVALEHVQRGVEAEHFFGAGGGVREEVGGGGVAEEGLRAVAKGVDGGFVSGVEKEDGGGDEFVVGEGSAVVVAGGEELREEVVAGMTATFGQVGTHVIAEGDGGGDGAVFDAAVAAGLIHGDHVVGPGEDLRGHVGGDTEKAGDDHDGNGFGEGFDEVGGMVGFELVDELVGEGFDLRAEAFDLAGEEGGIDEAAEAGVDGGLEFEEGMFFECVEGREAGGGFGPAEFLAGGAVENLASEAAVAEEGADVFVFGEAPEVVEIGPAEDGGFGAEFGVEGVGVLDERLVAGVEGDCGVGDGHGENGQRRGRRRYKEQVRW